MVPSQTNPRPRVLIVGMADSIHLARWLKQFEGQDYDFRLVSSSPHRRIHPIIREMLVKQPVPKANLSISWVSKYLSLPMWLADRFLGDSLRGSLIAWEIRRFKPVFVHALELQNAGYSVLRAYKLLKNKQLVLPKLFVTNYGSDIYWFKQFPKHAKKLRELLSLADAYSAECSRDSKLATELGFKGLVLGIAPNSGGLEFDSSPEFSKESLAKRKTIAIKGYQNKWGQALVALGAIETIASELSDYTIELFSCNRVTIQAAKKLAQQTGLKIISHPKHKLSHSQVLEIMARSRVYIGLSKSDGISTSMLEAMSQGAIPIQSNTACGNEWIRDEIDGFLVRFDDQGQVAKAVRRVIQDDEYVLLGQKQNFETVRIRYSSKHLSEIGQSYYSSLLLSNYC